MLLLLLLLVGWRGGAGAGTVRSTPVARARASSLLFAIFPPRVGARSCRIPRGGAYSAGNMTIPGRCSTTARRPTGFGGMSVVSFTERWDGMTRFDPRRALHHTWRMTVTAGGNVVDVRESGAAAPQSWS